MAVSPLMQLTRIDGVKIIIVKTAMVSWSRSNDHLDARTVHLATHTQDVIETEAEISALFTKGL